MIDTMYNLDQIVYLPFRIVNIRIEKHGEGNDNYYRLIPNFTEDGVGFEGIAITHHDVSEDVLFEIDYQRRKQND